MRRGLFVLVAVLAVCTATAQTAHSKSPLFKWVEATIGQTHAAFKARSLDCEALVNGYLDRIRAFDRRGPGLHSVIAVNPSAIKAARALDTAWSKRKGPTGALHCVPILLKDNIDAAGMPTTAGATVLARSRPPDDAFVVSRLRKAGAVVLGKANLDEFALGFNGSSSIGGLVRNAYDPKRGAGGSSSGTGAAVAASLAMLGLGTDTGGSIRVPSSAGGLVGIRPSLRLLSQDGILPLAHFQDAVGPMCRRVEDCAAVLDAMTGFDPSKLSGQNTKPLERDDESVLIKTRQEYRRLVGSESAVAALDRHGLKGARIGVVRAMFGDDPDVTRAMNAAIAAMRSAGAIVKDVTIADLDTIFGSYASVSRWEFRDHLSQYLQSWPSTKDGHPRTFEQVAASLGYETMRVPTFALYGASGAIRYSDPDYERNTQERPSYVRARVLAAMNNAGDPYDALLYPTVLSPPMVGGPPTTGNNNRLSPFTGFPALTMPAAFTARTRERVALPIGMELLAREFDEETLVRLAFSYQERVRGTALARRTPTFTPELRSARS